MAYLIFLQDMFTVTENREFKKTGSINSVQSSLQSHTPYHFPLHPPSGVLLKENRSAILSDPLHAKMTIPYSQRYHQSFVWSSMNEMSRFIISKTNNFQLWFPHRSDMRIFTAGKHMKVNRIKHFQPWKCEYHIHVTNN